jgi:hypothetical protein
VLAFPARVRTRFGSGSGLDFLGGMGVDRFDRDKNYSNLNVNKLEQSAKFVAVMSDLKYRKAHCQWHSSTMPRPPSKILPVKKAFLCPQCNRNFRSKAGRTRHINAKHGDLQMKSPKSEEVDHHLSDVSSCPGFPSPSIHSHAFHSPSRNSSTINFSAGSENDIDFGNLNDNTDDTRPPSSSSSQGMASLSREYHPYINGETSSL